MKKSSILILETSGILILVLAMANAAALFFQTPEREVEQVAPLAPPIKTKTATRAPRAHQAVEIPESDMPFPPQVMEDRETDMPKRLKRIHERLEMVQGNIEVAVRYEMESTHSLTRRHGEITESDARRAREMAQAAYAHRIAAIGKLILIPEPENEWE
jgi:hypothetical protein